jgi:hypothetical protein
VRRPGDLPGRTVVEGCHDVLMERRAKRKERNR